MAAFVNTLGLTHSLKNELLKLFHLLKKINMCIKSDGNNYRSISILYKIFKFFKKHDKLNNHFEKISGRILKRVLQTLQ